MGTPPRRTENKQVTAIPQAKVCVDTPCGPGRSGPRRADPEGRIGTSLPGALSNPGTMLCDTSQGCPGSARFLPADPFGLGWSLPRE